MLYSKKKNYIYLHKYIIMYKFSKITDIFLMTIYINYYYYFSVLTGVETRRGFVADAAKRRVSHL